MPSGLSRLIRFKALAFSADGTTLAAAGDVRELLLWNVPKRRLLHNLIGHQDSIYAIAFSPDGKLLASGGGDFGFGDHAIRIWDVATGQARSVLKRHSSQIRSLLFTPDGKTLISAGHDDKIRFWDTKTWQVTREISTEVQFATLSSDGAILASCDYCRTICLWDAASGKPLRKLRGTQDARILAFSPDSKTLAATGWAPILTLWNVATGKRLQGGDAHEDGVSSLLFTADGKRLISRSYDHTVRVWDIAKGATVRRWDIDTPEIYTGAPFTPFGQLKGLALARNGRVLAASSIDFKGRYTYCWDMASGQKVAQFQEDPFAEGACAWPLSVDVAPDGDTLATTSMNGISLWSLRTGRRRGLLRHPLQKPTDPCGYQITAFSPDGTILAAGGDRSIELWDWTSGKQLRQFPVPHAAIGVLQFSPDGALLASCGLKQEGTVNVWEVVTGARIHAIRAHPDGAVTVAFSVDGRMLATAGESDKTVRVWSVFTGECLAEFKGHTSAVLSVAFSPDGKMLASGSADTTILLWDLHSIRASLPIKKLSQERLAALWSQLADSDSSRAYQALWSLVGASETTVDFLKTRFVPVHPPDEKQVRQLLTDLADDSFATREAAMRELRGLSSSIAPLLRQHLMASPSLDLRKRIKSILDEIGSRPFAVEELRAIRAVQVLEWIGSVQARELLAPLAKGEPATLLSRKAKIALHRLERDAKGR